MTAQYTSAPRLILQIISTPNCNFTSSLFIFTCQHCIGIKLIIYFCIKQTIIIFNIRLFQDFV